MTSPLQYFKSDPNKKGRGAGYYYRKGGYKKGWYSKYSEAKDAKIQSSTKKTPYVSKKFKHTGDGFKGRKV